MAQVVLEESEFRSLVDRLVTLERAIAPEEIKRTTFADLVEIKPFSTPRPIDPHIAEFGFIDYRNDRAWKAFLEVAKEYLRESDSFYMDRCFHGPYIRSISADPVRVIDKAPYEKQLIAAQMVREMVEVFNRYFVEAHKDVWYKPSPCEDAILVRVHMPVEKD